MNKAFKKHGKKSYSDVYNYVITDPSSIFYGWEKRHAPASVDGWVSVQYSSTESFAYDVSGELRVCAP